MQFTDSVKDIKGVGEKTAALLEKLNIITVGDLFSHFPSDYEEYAMPVRIDDVKDGHVCAIEGVVSRVTIKKGRRFIVTCYCSDPSGAIKLIWYNQQFITKLLKPGTRFLFRGTVKQVGSEYAIQQPKMFKQDEYRKLMMCLQPRYALTKGITHNFISKAVKNAFEVTEFPNDRLKPGFLRVHGLMKYSQALECIHFPDSMQEALTARKRLVFDEFVDFMLALKSLSEDKEKLASQYVINDFTGCDKMMNELPFELTAAQQKVLEDIKKDISSGHVMCRMVEGDVGSGKTVIALLACLAVVQNNLFGLNEDFSGKKFNQAAVMVPTEVLARQHYEEFSERLSKYGIKCALLTGSVASSEKKKIYSQIADGDIQVVIGTHALIQEKLEFSSLGLVVIDEQHRFGVKQRETLKEKGLNPHILSMSATPIPRSLSLVLYGDMDVSVINEMPAERLPIKNCVIDYRQRNTAINFIRKEVTAGHQAYIICPMVEESEDMEGENVIDYTESLRESLEELNRLENQKNIGKQSLDNSKGYLIEYLHGKMKPAQKNDIMGRFASGDIDILVSTTVVEVGVNVKNATVMMIENSERFGLAQLHQLRGRVGRGKWQSYCIFVKGCSSREIDERLDILKNNNNGFKVAEEDLRLRGPGDLFGVRQAGELSWKLADIYADADMLALANEYVNGQMT